MPVTYMRKRQPRLRRSWSPQGPAAAERESAMPGAIAKAGEPLLDL